MGFDKGSERVGGKRCRLILWWFFSAERIGCLETLHLPFHRQNQQRDTRMQHLLWFQAKPAGGLPEERLQILLQRYRFPLGASPSRLLTPPDNSNVA